ncbi:leucine-rich repeat protein kinase family protein [Striga asiatica]|uniref:Leucine-rich repeat protein kinase family protein n=1 Tax=Striga asiatica TaxID=4170 RepID=A0A5A7PPR5_STRAF|nr:leucine-rich repeat protein kinase family protein [Striga asiatica]
MTLPIGTHRLLLLFAVAAAILLLHPASSDLASDRAALLGLRSAVGGRVLLWNLSSASPCVWPGVICSRDNSSVVELHLPGMGLSGQLPSNTVSNMTNLTTLSLRYNALSGPLPPDLFTSLISLRNLYLQHNFFIGQIPDSFYSLTSLVRVNLAENNFSGPISSSFQNLSRLGTLYLQGNHFSGRIPHLNLPSLVQFNVSNNNLTGEIPRGLSGQPRSSFAGNALCGQPLTSCTPKKKLSGGAIAGIIIGSVLGFLLILLLIFCLCRVLARKGSRSKDGVVAKEKELEIPVSVSGGGKDGGPSGLFAAKEKEKEKEKGESSLISGGTTKGLVFLGKLGWKFDLDDLLKASAEVLGKGTFGTAYKAVMENGLTVVVKRLRDVSMGEKEFKEKMEEIGRIDHENLVPLRAYHYTWDEKLLVYDHLPMGSLSALLHGNKGASRTPLNWETRAAIALGASRGIAHLHSQGPTISHGNIKSSNVLLTNSYEARVSDFGLAQLSGPAASPNRVAGYRAPEVTDPRKVSQRADVYSFGVLLLELLTGKAPTQSVANEDGVDLPRWVQSVVREEWTAEVFDLELLRYQSVEEDMVQLLQLAVDCTAQYPDRRPHMAEVVSRIEEICHSDGADEIVGLEEKPMEN